MRPLRPRARGQADARLLVGKRSTRSDTVPLSRAPIHAICHDHPFAIPAVAALAAVMDGIDSRLPRVGRNERPIVDATQRTVRCHLVTPCSNRASFNEFRIDSASLMNFDSFCFGIGSPNVRNLCGCAQ
jgi:hypothetical protein